MLQQQAYALAYLATRGKGSLYFLGYCMLVDLFYQLFMKKCERKFWLKLKKNIVKSDFQTATLIIITMLSCSLHIYA